MIRRVCYTGRYQNCEVPFIYGILCSLELAPGISSATLYEPLSELKLGEHGGGISKISHSMINFVEALSILQVFTKGERVLCLPLS